jgi:hypothetical protein
MQMTWDLHGRQLHSMPNEAYSMAELGLNGFRLLKDPA